MNNHESTQPASTPDSPDDPAEPPECTPDAPHPTAPAPTPAGPGCRVDLVLVVDEPLPPLTGWLDAKLGEAARAAGVTRGHLGVRVVDDAEMTRLHEQYSGEPGTTDVLTFDLRDHPDDPLEGDIVVCLDEARRQANRRGHDPRDESLLYAVHGLLHLLGEDDHDDDAYDRMHRREDELLTRIGLGPIFARSAGEASP